MTLWYLTKNEFAMEFLICSSGSHMYRLLTQHLYMEDLKDVTFDEIRQFYIRNIEKEVAKLVREEEGVKHNPDIWLVAIAVLIHNRTDIETGAFLEYLARFHDRFHFCYKYVFWFCWRRHQIKREWVKHVW